MDTQDNNSLKDMLYEKYSLFVESIKKFFMQQTLTDDWKKAVDSLNLNLCVQSSQNDVSDILLTDEDRVKPFIIENDEMHEIDNNVDDVRQHVLSRYNKHDVAFVDVNYIKYSKNDLVASYNISWIITYDKDFNESQRFFVKVILRFVEKTIIDLSNIRIALDDEFWKKQAVKMNFNLMNWYIKEIFDTKKIPEWEILTQIAFQNYENRVNKSTLIFLQKEDFDKLKDKTSGLLCFDSVSEIQNENSNSKVIKTVRKMLETCSQRNGHCCYLLAQSEMPYQLLGIITDKYFDTNIVEIYTYWAVEFLGNGDWMLSVGNNILFTYSKGRFLGNSQQIIVELEILVERIRQVKEHTNVFVNILKKLREQNHGALMIIAEDAEKEAKILCEKFKKGTLVSKVDFADEDNLRLLDGIASVDGAVLVDFSGICYGFSVILDGDAKVEGDLGRGSRYNSSINYVAGKERYAVIVSEDKDNGIEIVYGKDLKVMLRDLE